ncbi:hypothetical protein NC653_028468 [Populus alba x Populus x berolinensis]|uniref:Uncharacterized protein n=1 Tax=Populus alba x Populus x berolinensis TaxID=444605 RepID=A0AAD6Q3F5_9ROSI|nr:hypothetical protein NC653_028468 [Populus alba x Populus x berolinensis]
MADRAPTQRATRPTTTPTTHSGSTFLRKLQLHIGSNSSQLRVESTGSDQVDYARNRIYDTASHVKDYAREYGGYLQSKVKDAAPGA